MPKSPFPDLTPDQRFKQIAAILAKGVIRLHQRKLRDNRADFSQESPKSSTAGLEVPGKTRLSVSRCVGG